MEKETTSEFPCWYVVHTHPRQEDRAESNLRVLGVQTFTPKIKEKRYNNYTGEPAYLIKPLFPRYIFARFKIDTLYHKIRFVRGVRNLVSFDNYPIPVEEEIIAVIRSRIKVDGFVKMDEDLKLGDKVIIQSGPFKDFAGIFEQRIKDTDRITILLSAVSYQAHLVIKKELVKSLVD